MNVYSVAILPDWDSNVLILRRSFTATYGDLCWNLPGGLVEDGEEPIETAIRELKEEISIDVKSNDISLLFKTIENNGEEDFEVNYFLVRNEGEYDVESAILNFEHDKYELICDDDLTEFDFLDNQGEILSHYFDFVNQRDLEKSITSLTQPNPYSDEFNKGLNMSKLHIKDIVDKLGRHMKKWVKNDDNQSEVKTTKQEDNNANEPSNKKVENPKGKSSDYDYHSIYQDNKKVESHAKKSSTEDLKNFLDKEHDNPKARILVDSAKKELAKRGEEYINSEDDRNPYKNKEGDKKADNKTEDSKPDDKRAEGEGDSKPENPKEGSEDKTEKPKSDKVKEETKKPEKVDVSKLSEDEKKKLGIQKLKDGEYNPKTGAGWNGDQSIGLDDNQKREITSTAHSIIGSIKTLMSDESPKLMTIISGKAGVGKSYNVEKAALGELGYDKINKDQPYDPEEHPNGSYVELKGTGFNYGDFLAYLYKYRGQEGSKTLLSFDDSDSMLFNPKTINLLKNFEGKTPKITITPTFKKKIADLTGENVKDIPDEFDFHGKLNFITNKGLDDSQDSAALKGRSKPIHIDLDKKQMLYAMSTMLDGKLRDGYDNFEQNKELYDVLVKNQKNLPESDLQVRTLGNIKEAKMTFGNLPKETQDQYEDWKDYYAESLKKVNIKKAFDYLLGGVIEDDINFK